jgi:hypothetical protein
MVDSKVKFLRRRDYERRKQSKWEANEGHDMRKELKRG